MGIKEEFQRAGSKPGLIIWRIENLDLKPVPECLFGSFFIGDAYIVFHATKAPSYSIHMWLGNECSQDESTAAAILATQLDEHLGGKPVQYRETQGSESTTFLAYFKTGITYKKGGAASGLRHVVTNDLKEERVIQVKGKRFPRGKEQEFSWKSFNKGDCFIIIAGANIYQWMGSRCNKNERVKALSLAVGIRDGEKMGRAKLCAVEEGEEPAELLAILGPKPNIPDGDGDEEDEKSDIESKKSAKLYMISDASGKMKTSEVASAPPFTQDMLSSNESYILDNGQDKKIYVWKGQSASPSERREALKAANEFISQKNYPKNTQVVVLPQGGETTEFKQFFSRWQGKDDTTGPRPPYVIGRIAKIEQVPFDVSSLHTSPAMAAQHGMVDDGSGKVQIWRIEDGDKKPVPPSSYGQFYGGDCYLILYTYKGNKGEQHFIYIWQGQKATRDELTASAFMAVQLDDSYGGLPVQVRVPQGSEPPHLMSLFKGKPLIIHAGGTSRGSGQTPAASNRLFHVRCSTSKASRAVEVKADASSLNSNDAFVLKTPQSVYLWKGTGVSDDEVTAAKSVVSTLGGSAKEINEGSEPADFWSILGGKKSYQTSAGLKCKQQTYHIRLFACSNKTGRFTIEEVPGDFSQADLATDDVMLLDAGNQIMLWIGNEANDVEKKESPLAAQKYVDTDPARKGMKLPISVIKQGCEPPTFTGWFLGWDPHLWQKNPLDQFKGMH
ncbi:adseverin-like [Protopterus annectens]|uniref:adseverin-like n=1 Tax=Protopterus annectens TaxID=7888 RepID=UPI001CF99C0D|nr:adseverin-like [Protopterus annectens]